MRVLNLSTTLAFSSLVLCHKFDVVLNLESHGNSDLAGILEKTKGRGWNITPRHADLVSNLEQIATNRTLEIPIPIDPGFDDVENVTQMVKSGLHTLFRLDTGGEWVGLDKTEQLSRAEEVKLILSNPLVKSVREVTQVTNDRLLHSNGDMLNHHVPDKLRGNSNLGPFFECSAKSSKPCQAYLHLNDTPSMYKAPGNNVSDAWSKFDVRGEGVKVAICELGSIHKHSDLSVKATVISSGQASTVLDDTSHKLNTAGIVYGSHNNKGVYGIVPKVDKVIDIDIDEELTTPVAIHEIGLLLGPGDVVCAAVGAYVTDEDEMEQVEKYDPDCVTYGCDYPITFVEHYYNLFSYLESRGVSVFVAAGNGNTNLGTKYWTKFLGKWKQVGALVGGWDPAVNLPDTDSAYVYPLNDSLVKMQFTNWSNDVISTDIDDTYIMDYSGSSSATAITCGVGALVQSAALKYLGGALSPSKLYDLIYDTGRVLKNTNPHTKHKDMSRTRLPDAYAAIEKIVDMSKASSSSSGKITTQKKTTKATKTTTKKATKTTTKKAAKTTTSKKK